MNSLYFLRHCKTFFNKEKIISGQKNVHIYPGQKICNLKVIDSRKKLIIFSSDLIRCVETINILLSSIKVEYEIYYNRLLEERNLGILEGGIRSKIIEKYPDLFKGQRFLYYKTPPNGETYENFKLRLYRVYNLIIKYLEKNDILICSHNQVLKFLYCMFLNISIESNWFNIDFDTGKIYKIN